MLNRSSFTIARAAFVETFSKADCTAPRAFSPNEYLFVLSPVFSYGMLWFDRDAYVQYLVEKGTEQTYMDTMVSTAQNWMLPAMIIGVLICAAISGLVGQKLLKKHFEKAGVV